MELSNSQRKIEIIEKMLLAIDDLFPISEKYNWETCNRYIFHAFFVLNFAVENNLDVVKTAKVHYKTKLHCANNQVIGEMLKLQRMKGNLKSSLIDI